VRRYGSHHAEQPGDADISAVVGWCNRAGNDCELRPGGLGDLTTDGPGVLVAANSMQVFDVIDTLPASAR